MHSAAVAVDWWRGCLPRGCLPGGCLPGGVCSGGCLPGGCLPSRCLPGVSSQEGVSARVCVCIPARTGWEVSAPARAGIHLPPPMDNIATLCTMGKLECVQQSSEFPFHVTVLQMSKKIKSNKF